MTKYRVILTNGSVEFLNEQEANDYNKEQGGIRVDSITEAAPEPVADNPSIPNWKLRIVLTSMGLIQQVNDLLNSLPEPDKTMANIAWEYGTTIEITSPTVQVLQQGLSLSKQDVINIFNSAYSIDI